ncbi:hypothetical protein BpHYR1_018271 [Brachionus plicatilis]|uniref:Uncharacterized protein n=1 Tax=Brachionus plicatilis TaxID=10195 RepID=A0A3M7QMY2_BRAPC|nr:hypothetical protein BpHYR1_018271 [Brachionus plicatilis]
MNPYSLNFNKNCEANLKFFLPRSSIFLAKLPCSEKNQSISSSSKKYCDLKRVKLLQAIAMI